MLMTPNLMRKRFLLTVLLVTLLVHACSAPQPQTIEQAAPTAIISQPVPTQETETVPLTEASPAADSGAVDCLGGETSPIAESIAEEYEFTSYAEVVTWFCDGAEFEDILVALETESQTGTPAEEMLQMLANGASWEEIWGFIGLTD